MARRRQRNNKQTRRRQRRRQRGGAAAARTPSRRGDEQPSMFSWMKAGFGIGVGSEVAHQVMEGIFGMFDDV